MKRVIRVLFSVLALLVLVGCPTQWLGVTTPTAFTQKVLIEEATGGWCGWCPQGANVLKDVIDANPGLVFGAAYHRYDEMEIDAATELANGVGGMPYYPSGAVNRTPYAGNSDPTALIFMSRGYWGAATNLILGTTATCGLKLVTSVSGSRATIQVHIGFAEVPAEATMLAIMVTEDGVTGYEQHNYDPALGADPIPGYVFMHVVRDYVTPVFGVGVDLTKVDVGSGLQRSFEYTIPAGLAAENLNVIAFLHTYGPNPEDKKILNVQAAALGETEEWD